MKKGEGGRGRDVWAVAATLAALMLLGGFVRIAGLAPWHLAWDEAWHLLGLLLSQTPALPEAADCLRKAVQLVPELLLNRTIYVRSSPSRSTPDHSIVRGVSTGWPTVGFVTATVGALALMVRSASGVPW